MAVVGTTTLHTLILEGDLTVNGDLAFGSSVSLVGSLTVGHGLSVGSNTTLTGTLSAAGNVSFGAASTNTITITSTLNSDLIPNASNTYDLGKTGTRFKDGFFSGTLNTTNFQAAGTALFGSGSVSNPGIAFIANTAAGFELASSNSVGLVINGAVPFITSDSSLSINVPATLVQGLSVGSNTTIVGTLSATGNVAVAKNLTIGSNTTITGTLTATGGVVGSLGTASAAAGNLGEYLSASTLRGPGGSTAVSLATGSASNLLASPLALTAGDWIISGAVGFLPGSLTTITNLISSISTTSQTIGGSASYANPDTSGNVTIQQSFPGTVIGSDFILTFPSYQLRTSSSVSVYLVAQSSFGVSTLKGYGSITARRAI